MFRNFAFLACLVCVLVPSFSWGQPGPINPEDFATDPDKLKAAITDNVEANMQVCLDAADRITQVVYNRTQWASQKGMPDLLIAAVGNYKLVCEKISPRTAEHILGIIERAAGHRQAEPEEPTFKDPDNSSARANSRKPKHAKAEKVIASDLKSRPYESYPHAISPFMLRQTCRNIIQQRFNNWNIDFQHADLMQPARLENMSRWFSWFVVPRTAIRQHFLCSHNALTDWAEVRFTKRD